MSETDTIPLPSTAQEIFEVLAGGRDVRVRTKLGEMILVKLIKVPVKQMAMIGNAWGSMTKEVEVYTGQNEAWQDTIEDDALLLLWKAGREVNFTTFDTWLEIGQQSLKTMSKQSPEIMQMLERNLQETLKAEIGKLGPQLRDKSIRPLPPTG